MIATKPIEIRANMKKYMDLAYNGEPVIISRKQNRNVVILSEKEYNEMQKAVRNTKYLAMIDQSYNQLKEGEVIHKSLSELEKIADE